MAQSRYETKVIMPEISVALSREGARIFRNNVGLFRTIDGRKIRTGLCVGSSDLVGWTPVVITEKMVGKKIAVFSACEVKHPGKKPTPEQYNFISEVNKSGGIAFVATSGEEAVEKLRRMK